MKRWIVAVGVAASSIACGGGDLLGPTAAQGIDGMVTIGPVCPVQTLDDPCPDAPYQAWIGVRRPTGAFVTRVRSAEDGTFRVGLRPGRYVLEPETEGRWPMAGEQVVDVVPGEYAEILIAYDSGIR